MIPRIYPRISLNGSPGAADIQVGAEQVARSPTSSFGGGDASDWAGLNEDLLLDIFKRLTQPNGEWPERKV
jgi:hypothetical protein